MRCVIDTLKEMGHEVVATTNPASVKDETFDLVICSHNRVLLPLVENLSAKICISQGVVIQERLMVGAHLYYSISDEVRRMNLKTSGIDSRVIEHPLKIPENPKPINKKLTNILVIRGSSYGGNNFTAFLGKKYNLRVSNMDQPIEPQIEWADLCISLGRGALQAMSYGRVALVADHRTYLGRPMADGILKPGDGTYDRLRAYNLSGRACKINPTRAWIERQLEDYDPAIGEWGRELTKKNNDRRIVVGGMVRDAAPVIRVKQRMRSGINESYDTFHDYLIKNVKAGP